MRKALVIFLILLPWSARGEGTSRLDERKAAEEDICYAQSEYIEAKNLFYDETHGSYNPSSPQGRYARDYERKRQRLKQVQERYIRWYGKAYEGGCRYP